MTSISTDSTAHINAIINPAQRTHRADLATQRSIYTPQSDRTLHSDITEKADPLRNAPPLSEPAQRRIRLIDSADRALDHASRSADVAERLINIRNNHTPARKAAEEARVGASLADLALNTAEAGDPVEARATVGRPDPIKMIQDTAEALGRPVRLPGIAEMARNLGMKSGATIEHGDINGDGRVGLDDFNMYAINYYDTWVNTPIENAIPSYDILSANFGKDGMSLSQGDLDGDGKVSLSDFNIYAIKFSTPAAGSEPTTNVPIAPDIRMSAEEYTPTPARQIASTAIDAEIRHSITETRESADHQRARASQLRERIVAEDLAQQSTSLLGQLATSNAQRIL